MSRLTLAVLLAALAACQKPAPPASAPPTPEALGAELATFRQILVPISTQTWSEMQWAVSHGDEERSKAYQYPQPYAHALVPLNGRDTDVLVAYTSIWLAPDLVPLQPMSVEQYLRAFEADTGTNLATLIAPMGTIFFTREQLPGILAAAKASGASSTDLPYSVVRGAAR